MSDPVELAYRRGYVHAMCCVADWKIPHEQLDAVIDNLSRWRSEVTSDLPVAPDEFIKEVLSSSRSDVQVYQCDDAEETISAIWRAFEMIKDGWRLESIRMCNSGMDVAIRPCSEASDE